MLKWLFFPFVICTFEKQIVRDSVIINVRDVYVSASVDSLFHDKVEVTITNELKLPISISRQTITYFESHKFPGEVSIEILNSSKVRGIYYDEISICGIFSYDTILPKQSKTIAIPIVLTGLRENMKLKARLSLTLGSWDNSKLWKSYESNVFNVWSEK